MRIDTVLLYQSLKLSLSVPVKKEEDIGLYIKEENLRDGHSRETQSEMDRERDMKDNSEKKGGRETDREDHNMSDSSKEVRKKLYICFIHSVSFLSHS